MAGVGTAHAAVGVVVQEAEPQLGPVLVIATAGRCAALLIIGLLPCRGSGLLMLTLGAFGYAASAGRYAVGHFRHPYAQE